jgi:hypothetical protein
MCERVFVFHPHEAPPRYISANNGLKNFSKFRPKPLMAPYI